ncbi:hypothetical protein FXO38_10721 [Capsicum annuum]|nr:hypothetical protein FXO37_30148 [Capsicum annuum]KAF3663292.1 hypothetical protein FXO38_10721 [Capsicum annuum]
MRASLRKLLPKFVKDFYNELKTNIFTNVKVEPTEIRVEALEGVHSDYGDTHEDSNAYRTVFGIQLRRNEKKLLNDINIDKDNRLRFHILGDKAKRKMRVQTREEKIFVLANDCLTGDPFIHDLSLSQDMNAVCANGYRIVKCMKEYFLYRKNYRGALSSALLTKSLYQKVWDDSPYLLKQLPGIGMVTAKAVHSMGVKSFSSLSDADPRKIEMVTGRKNPFGNHIKESINILVE